ncbi:MAG: CRISPR-associated endonuclease Cas1 [Candidatus Bathyarchaeia archaeon]
MLNHNRNFLSVLSQAQITAILPNHQITSLIAVNSFLNNLFNLGYELLSWKAHKALVNAKLEPYLGFLHSEQFGKPSLVCDFMEITIIREQCSTGSFSFLISIFFLYARQLL